MTPSVGRLAAVVVVLALAGCHDHPDPKPTPTPSASASPSASPSPSPTLTPTPPSPAPTTPLASPSPDPPAGFPTPDTTGARSTQLTDDPRCTLSTAGEVLERRRLTCPQRITVTAASLTIRDSVVVTGLNNWSSAGGRTMLLEDVTVGSLARCTAAGDFALGAMGMTLRRVEVYGLDAVRISQRGPGTVLIEDSYLAACSVTNSHSDGIQADGTTGGHTIRHNTIDMTAADSMTAALFWGDAAEGPVTVVDNLVMGYRNWGTFLASMPVDPDGDGIYEVRRHVVDGNRFVPAAGGDDNRSDQCGHIQWGTDNRAAAVSGHRVTSVGAEVAC